MFGSILSRVIGFAVCIAAFVAMAMVATNFFRIDRAIESALIGAGMLALAGLAGFLFGRRLAAPVGDLTRTLDLLAQGGTDMAVPTGSGGTRSGPWLGRSRRSARARPRSTG
jgi:hypothetical protein